MFMGRPFLAARIVSAKNCIEFTERFLQVPITLANNVNVFVPFALFDPKQILRSKTHGRNPRSASLLVNGR